MAQCCLDPNTLWKVGGRLSWLVLGLAFAWGLSGAGAGAGGASSQTGRETESPDAAGEVSGS